MKKIKFNKVSKIILAFVFTLGLAGIIYAALPTTPDLGAATTFGVLSTTYTANGTSTAITGDLGYTILSSGDGVNYTVSGGTDLGSASPYSTAGSNQGTALTNLNGQYTAGCTLLGVSGAVNLDNVALHTTGHYTPGCYYSDGAMNITANQTITLDGAGTYIFHALGALTPKADTKVILNGASACDVFWTPTEATTIGAYTGGVAPSATPTFIGTIIDDAGITIGQYANLLGRALSFASTVTTDTNIITVPTCTLPHLTVTKVVVGGGPKVAADFPLFVDDVSFTTEIAKEVSVGSHTVTETTDSNYTQTFSANCPGGIISLASGLASEVDQTCTITNTYITPVSTSSSGGRGYSIIYGCKDPSATNYNAFSASKPELCIYEPTITILSTPVVVAPIIPKFPKTGFPPRGEGDSFFDFLFSNILNLFR